MKAKNRTGSVSKASNKKRLVVGLLNAAVIIGLGVFGTYYFVQYNDLKNNPPAPEEQAKAEVDRFVAEIGALYDLPDDEEPSVATVSDKDQLGNQPFFDQAENGDVTLIYSEAKLAILYRPSTKKLINVSTLTVQDSPQITVIGPSGARGEVVAALANRQITATEGDSSSSSPKNTLVIDISGENEATVEQLSQLVDGSVGDLPDGEEVPEGTDILIIAVPDAEPAEESSEE